AAATAGPAATGTVSAAADSTARADRSRTACTASAVDPGRAAAAAAADAAARPAGGRRRFRGHAVGHLAATGPAVSGHVTRAADAGGRHVARPPARASRF